MFGFGFFGIVTTLVGRGTDADMLFVGYCLDLVSLVGVSWMFCLFDCAFAVFHGIRGAKFSIFSQVEIIFWPTFMSCLSCCREHFWSTSFHDVERMFLVFFMTCFVVFSCMVISLEMCHIFDITTAKEAWFAWFLLAP
jgi:hypothetical protein